MSFDYPSGREPDARDSLLAWIMHLFIYNYGTYKQFLDATCPFPDFTVPSQATADKIIGTSWFFLLDNAARVPVSVCSLFSSVHTLADWLCCRRSSRNERTEWRVAPSSSPHSSPHSCTSLLAVHTAAEICTSSTSVACAIVGKVLSDRQDSGRVGHSFGLGDLGKAVSRCRSP